MDNTKIVGEKIKSLRETKQISIAELAERTGLAIEQIERIENNVDIPSLAPLIKIARALGVRLGTFLDDQEEVANIFKKYNWMALPVTDKENRMVGIITVDDIVDVIEQETTEDMELMNAVLPSDDEYLKMSVIGLSKNRIPWLCVLMISGTLSAFVIGMYQELLDSVVVLSSFMTIITGTGGNAGSQASAMIIRGLALGEIQMRDTLKVVFKELRVGAICGLVLAIVNMIRMSFFDSATPFNIDLTVSISMGVAVVLAKTLGCSLPILAKAVKLDPAMMAGPLITTVVDAIALVVYFSIATALIL